MTLRLILIRHAKSSWDAPLVADHDRDLNDRGRRSAEVIGEWMADKRYHPEVVLCSTARRTVETWKRISPHIGGSARLELNTVLYHGTPKAMQTVLAGRREDAVLMLGHNPGIGEFADMLLDARPAHPKFAKFPTAATAVIDFDGEDWQSARPGDGRLADFVVPRDLLPTN